MTSERRILQPKQTNSPKLQPKKNSKSAKEHEIENLFQDTVNDLIKNYHTKQTEITDIIKRYKQVQAFEFENSPVPNGVEKKQKERLDDLISLFHQIINKVDKNDAIQYKQLQGLNNLCTEKDLLNSMFVSKSNCSLRQSIDNFHSARSKLNKLIEQQQPENQGILLVDNRLSECESFIDYFIDALTRKGVHDDLGSNFKCDSGYYKFSELKTWLGTIIHQSDQRDYENQQQKKTVAKFKEYEDSIKKKAESQQKVLEKSMADVKKYESINKFNQSVFTDEPPFENSSKMNIEEYWYLVANEHCDSMKNFTKDLEQFMIDFESIQEGLSSQAEVPNGLLMSNRLAMSASKHSEVIFYL